MAPVPNCTLEEMRTKANLSELSETKPLNPFVNALLANNSTALLAGILAHTKK